MSPPDIHITLSGNVSHYPYYASKNRFQHRASQPWIATVSSISRIMLFVCAAAMLAATVHAREVRLPSTGSPALIFQVPDDWIVGDERGAWIINVVNALPSSVAFSITITADSREPEEYITQEMTKAGGDEPVHVGKAKVGGFDADVFESTGLSPSNQQLHLQHIVAHIDAGYLLAVTKITAPNGDPKEIAQAEELIKSMRIVSNSSLTHNKGLHWSAANDAAPREANRYASRSQPRAGSKGL